MATWNPPVVPVFPAGYAPQATDFNTWWYQTGSFLQNRVVFRASQTTTATSLPDTGSAVTIAYDNVIEDPYSGWSASTHLWTPPAGYSGFYQATITLRIVQPASLVFIEPRLAGTYTTTLAAVQGQSNAGAGVSGTFTVYLVGGQDTLGAEAQLLNSGSNLNTSLTAGQQSSLEIVYLSQS
jgi:hypothetical protein